MMKITEFLNRRRDFFRPGLSSSPYYLGRESSMSRISSAWGEAIRFVSGPTSRYMTRLSRQRNQGVQQESSRTSSFHLSHE